MPANARPITRVLCVTRIKYRVRVYYITRVCSSSLRVYFSTSHGSAHLRCASIFWLGGIHGLLGLMVCLAAWFLFGFMVFLAL
jgi:hypothetical protein